MPLSIATGADKVDPTGTEVDGIAKYTKSAEAGKPLVTPQRELTQYFGNVDFKPRNGIQGDETNEYGLLAAYLALGATSIHCYANVDLHNYVPDALAITSNTYWFNPTSSFGI